MQEWVRKYERGQEEQSGYRHNRDMERMVSLAEADRLKKNKRRSKKLKEASARNSIEEEKEEESESFVGAEFRDGEEE